MQDNKKEDIIDNVTSHLFWNPRQFNRNVCAACILLGCNQAKLMQHSIKKNNCVLVGAHWGSNHHPTQLWCYTRHINISCLPLVRTGLTRLSLIDSSPNCILIFFGLHCIALRLCSAELRYIFLWIENAQGISFLAKKLSILARNTYVMHLVHKKGSYFKNLSQFKLTASSCNSIIWT